MSSRPGGDWTYDRERLMRALAVECPLPAVPDASIVNYRPGVLHDAKKELGVDAQ